MEKRESRIFSVLVLPMDLETCVRGIRLEDYEPLPLSPIFLFLSSAAGFGHPQSQLALCCCGRVVEGMLPVPPSNQIGATQPPCALGLLQVPPTTLFLPVYSCPTAFLQP